MATTIGRLMVEEVLPPELRNIDRPLSVDEMEDALAYVIEKYPDKYKEVSKALLDLGGKASLEEGITLKVSDTLPNTQLRDVWLKHIDKQQKLIERTNATPQDKKQALSELYNTVHKQMIEENYEDAIKKNNPLALQVKSKARGTKPVLAQLMSTPGTFQDGKGNTIPLFIRHSYSEGLTPAEYWAATYGARKAVKATKLATAEAGEIGKQMVAAAMRSVVTGEDCGTLHGIPVAKDDPDNLGAVLARNVGDIPAGTVITKEILSKIPNKVDEILVRSPITCGEDKGICARCAGIRETGRFPEIGSYIGVTAGSALAERIAQGALNCLVEGTLVRMADFSVKPIEDIKVGDKVLGADIDATTFPVTVTATWDQGIQPTYRYDYSVGGTREHISVSCTEEHPILVNTKKSGCAEASLNYSLRKLPAGYKCHDVAAVLPRKYVSGESVAEPFAFLIGAWIGDGCRNYGQGPPIISCADEADSNKYKEECNLLGLDFVKKKRSFDWAVVDRQPLSGIRRRDGTFVKGYLNRFKRLLADIDLLGKYAHEKKLPTEVYTWNTESVLQLLAGYLLADGSVYTLDHSVGMAFGSTSYELLVGLKDLLALRLCVYGSTITKIGRKGTDNRKHDSYSFYITRTPELLKLRDMFKLYGISNQKIVKLSGRIDLGNYDHHKDLYRCIKKKSTSLGPKQCYDISVDHPDELFVLANGIICKNTKHSGGQTSKGEEEYLGFDFVEQFLQIPKNFREQATLSSKAGRIDRIEAAPQGGHNIFIGDEVHFVLPDHELYVKEGDEVESGDQLSSGLVNPAEVVNYKGLGEGRRYFTSKLTDMLKKSGWKANRRNVEVLSRALIDHVTLDDAVGNGLPGDVMSYSNTAFNYKPREGSATRAVKDSYGKYLESPVLHYTIGTPVNKEVERTLGKFGIKNVMVHDDPAEFRPMMPSLRSAPFHEKDWMAQLGSSYLKSNLLKSVHRGAESTTKDLHPIPGIAKGVDFGIN